MGVGGGGRGWGSGGCEPRIDGIVIFKEKNLSGVVRRGRAGVNQELKVLYN